MPRHIRLDKRQSEKMEGKPRSIRSHSIRHLLDKPFSCIESGCPLAVAGRGFVLGVGDPRTARLAVNLEAPGKDEVTFNLFPHKGDGERLCFNNPVEAKAELTRRKRDYPDIPVELLSRGAPIVGRTGEILHWWTWPAAGVKFKDLFVDNTIRCLPPKEGENNYPTGEIRRRAEQCCRQYDRWHLMKADCAVISFHPAGIAREVTPLPLLVENFRKAMSFVAQKMKVVVLCGGKAVKVWLGRGENVTFWQGDYEAVGEPRTKFAKFDPNEPAAKKREKRGKKPEAAAEAREKIPRRDASGPRATRRRTLWKKTKLIEDNLSLGGKA